MRWRRATMGKRARTQNCSNRSQLSRQRRQTCSSICLTCRDASLSSNSKSAMMNTTDDNSSPDCVLISNGWSYFPILTTIRVTEEKYHRKTASYTHWTRQYSPERYDEWSKKCGKVKHLAQCAKIGEKVRSLITIKVNKERDRSLIYAIFIHSHKIIKI